MEERSSIRSIDSISLGHFTLYSSFGNLSYGLDLTKVGMGAVRSKRFAMVVEDLKVTYIGVETQ